jgi:hypothetical protein
MGSTMITRLDDGLDTTLARAAKLRRNDEWAEE